MDPTTTCWTLIRGAAAGNAADRELFAHRYQPAVRAYLEARWRKTPILEDLEDAVQDVFMECFREEGALSRVQPGGPGGFRAFLYVVVRNVARRVEDRRRRKREEQPDSGFDAPDLKANEQSLATVFDRAWLASLLDQAVSLQQEQAEEKGPAAVRRVELLRLRFNDELPIREIAKKWNQPADFLHHEYAQARKEFMGALRDVVAFHHPDDPEALKREMERFKEYLE